MLALFEFLKIRYDWEVMDEIEIIRTGENEGAETVSLEKSAADAVSGVGACTDGAGGSEKQL